MKIDEEEDSLLFKARNKRPPKRHLAGHHQSYTSLTRFFFPFKFTDLVVDRNKAMLPPDDYTLVIYKTLLPMHICGFFEAEKYGS